MANQFDESQYKLVSELLKRQDQALEQLDLLCERVEHAIKENLESRDIDECATSIDGNDIERQQQQDRQAA